jgi:hypothetical protein
LEGHHQKTLSAFIVRLGSPVNGSPQTLAPKAVADVGNYRRLSRNYSWEDTRSIPFGEHPIEQVYVWVLVEGGTTVFQCEKLGRLPKNFMKTKEKCLYWLACAVAVTALAGCSSTSDNAYRGGYGGYEQADYQGQTWNDANPGPPYEWQHSSPRAQMER